MLLKWLQTTLSFLLRTILPLVFFWYVKKADNSDDDEHVSYDVKSLFANILVKETLEYILRKIYVDKSIKPFCKGRFSKSYFFREW